MNLINNKEELINPADSMWKASKCCSCQRQFTSEQLQKEDYHLYKIATHSELLMMLFHKKCWTEFDQGLEKAWQQIRNDPIYRWSMGKKIKNHVPTNF